MQDPYVAVKEEVEHSVTVVVDLHKRWLELSEGGTKSEEFEWTSTELLSGLRSIEWDLQDLEDTVSIVEGKLARFQLTESDVQARKGFIADTRSRITAMRDEVQAASSEVEAGKGGTSGFSTGGGSVISKVLPGASHLPGSMGKKGKGYGQVGAMDMELGAAEEGPAGGSSRTARELEIEGEILDAPMGELAPAPGRHRKKKICLLVTVLLLLAGGAGLALSGGGDAKANVKANVDLLVEKTSKALAQGGGATGRLLQREPVCRPPRPALHRPPPSAR